MQIRCSLFGKRYHYLCRWWLFALIYPGGFRMYSARADDEVARIDRCESSRERSRPGRHCAVRWGRVSFGCSGTAEDFWSVGLWRALLSGYVTLREGWREWCFGRSVGLFSVVWPGASGRWGCGFWTGRRIGGSRSRWVSPLLPPARASYI